MADNTITVRFELNGEINPRQAAFDHHGEVSHADGFIVKMASVQLIEWLVMTGQDPQAISLELNHCGHVDDMIAHAVPMAAEQGKLRSLYRFACVVSVIDSCGPSGYALIQKDDRAIVDAAYGAYHGKLGGIAKELDLPKWKVPLDRQVECSKAAAAVIVEALPEDDYEATEPDSPPEDAYEVVARDEGIWLVEVLDADRCNVLRYSAFFYASGARAIVGYFDRGEGRRDYTGCVRSSYDGDLSSVWPQLAAKEEVPEKCRNWGGHSGAGGSPMPNESVGFPGGSVRKPSEVYDLVKAAFATDSDSDTDSE